MGIKTKTFLKDSNKDFNNVLDSMPVLGDANIFTAANNFSAGVPAQGNAYTLVADAGNDTTITNLVSGYEYYFGTVTGVPASETIYYIANDNGVFIEAATTVAGVDGTANTMVKLANSHGQIGDTYEAVSTSLTSWVLTINGRNGLIAAGDIAVDPGNVGGYID